MKTTPKLPDRHTYGRSFKPNQIRGVDVVDPRRRDFSIQVQFSQANLMAAFGCSTAQCCQRHPHAPSCARTSRAVIGEELAVSEAPSRAPSPAATTRLVLSAPIAAYVPIWYLREAVGNWLRFTTPSTRCVLHIDRARRDNVSRSLPEASRVLINPLRLSTGRRTGSILAAHMQNFLFARSLRPTHLLFLAHNCFFYRPGIESYVCARDASAAIRACSEPRLRLSKHHCTTQPWFAALNAHKVTGRRLLIEGQFYPTAVLDEVVRHLEGQDVALSMALSVANRSSHTDQHHRRGQHQPSHVSGVSGAGTVGLSESRRERGGRESTQSLLEALPTVPCTAEETVLPALILRAPGTLFARLPPTESVVWIPKTLADGVAVDASTVRRLISSNHTPQLVCSDKPAALALLSAPSWPCAACPDALTWPQTKFLVKRVPDDEADASGVRRLIDGIAPAGRMSWSIGML